MMKVLLRLRFQAFFAGLFRQNKKKKKKLSGGTIALFAFLYLYMGIVACGMMAFLFSALAKPYHAAGLDWLYYSLAGTIALSLSVLGSVFTTQNQLYDARDNDLLLCMPIPPQKILLSRMLPLLAMNLLLSSMVILPAAVVYAVMISFSLWHLLLQLLCMVGITLLAQAISCLLGWVLHLLLSRMNKSAASVIFMVLFLVLYFGIYSQANTILTAMASGGAAIAGAFETWVYPLYAMGRGAVGNLPLLIAFLAICAAVFALVYRFLSVTLLTAATSRRSNARKKPDLQRLRSASAKTAIVRKELHRFLGCPVYLTNMGLGLITMPVMAAAGILFRGKLFSQLGELLPVLRPYAGLAVAVLMGFSASMTCISAPSVSLEGKNLWILKSLPLSPRQILLGKLRFHCMMSAPICFVSSLALAIGYGCPWAQLLPAALIPALLCVFSGLLGLLCDLKFARFDWISEAYPCKQAAPVALTIFSVMGLALLLVVGFYLLMDLLSPLVYLILSVFLFLGGIAVLYRSLMTWGCRRWEHLQN